MSHRARIYVENSKGVEVYIKIKDGKELNQEAMEYIAEIAIDTNEGNTLEEIIEYFEENGDDTMLAELEKIEMVHVDWPNMPDQSGWRAVKIDTMKNDEKVDFYQSQYNDKFNA